MAYMTCVLDLYVQHAKLYIVYLINRHLLDLKIIRAYASPSTPAWLVLLQHHFIKRFSMSVPVSHEMQDKFLTWRSHVHNGPVCPSFNDRFSIKFLHGKSLQT